MGCDKNHLSVADKQCCKIWGENAIWWVVVVVVVLFGAKDKLFNKQRGPE